MSGSPQLEDGFTRIANELLEAILAAKLSKRQLAVVLAIIRLTYGWRKKTDDVTVTRIANLAGLDRSHASKTLTELEEMKITVPKRHGRRGYIVGINKDYGTWGGVPKRDTVPKRHADRTETARSTVPKRHTQKKTTKETPKRKANGARRSDRFADFWSVYPRKAGKKQCLAKWKARNLDRLADSIIADVERRMLKDVQWRRGFIPNPLTYINGDRWEDEVQRQKPDEDSGGEMDSGNPRDWI